MLSEYEVVGVLEGNVSGGSLVFLENNTRLLNNVGVHLRRVSVLFHLNSLNHLLELIKT